MTGLKTDIAQFDTTIQITTRTSLNQYFFQREESAFDLLMETKVKMNECVFHQTLTNVTLCKKAFFMQMLEFVI